MGILTLTMNPTVDVSCAVGHVVADRKLRCSAPVREPGGGGLNVARAIAQLGGSSQAVFPAGGATGELLKALLESHDQVHQHPVAIGGWTREAFVVDETATNRQFRFGMPGPELEEAEWRRCVAVTAELTHPGDHVVLSGSHPPGVPDAFVESVAELTRARDARLLVDTSGPALRTAVRVGAFLVKPNAGELAALVGRDHLDEAAQEAAARELVRGGCEVVVVSLGSAGVLLATADGRMERVAAPMVPVRSRVGAGDSTVAGIVLALSRGEDVAAAVRFGVAAGSAAVMSAGTGLCSRQDTEGLYARMARR